MIKSAIKSEAKILAELAIQLWNNHTVLELEEMFENLIQSDKAICFIKYVDNIAVGFAQCQIRTDYVEGTKTSPVGYLEGIFVVETYRHNGYAKELLLWYNHNESHVNDIRENSSRIRLVRLFLYPFLKKEGVNEKEGTYNGTACFARI